MKKLLLILLIIMMTGCNDKKEEKVIEDEYNIDYLVLVNKTNPLPEDWEENLKIVHTTNSMGDDVEVETKAYDAYLELKKELESEGIKIDLDSAYRSIATQQQIVDDFTERYGADYTAKVVATPGYSEHHTGLALDLYLNVDGKDVIYNEDLVTYPEIWEKIHEKLARYGFVLRYFQGKEHITGYAYEPWHIRYIDNKELAEKIMAENLTLESYLSGNKDNEVILDYGDSKLFSKEELDELFVLVKCNFATFNRCTLQKLRYGSDEDVNEENLKWINSLKEGNDYVQAVRLYSDFMSPSAEYCGTLNPDSQYTNYEWWLAKNKDNEWEIASFGY